MKNVSVKVLIGILVVSVLFAAVYFFYDSPVKYVRDQNGNIYYHDNGEPYAYYEDMFGRTYTREGGIRVYVAIPAYKEKA